WIRGRGDIEEIEGRKVQPIDDGYLSTKHATSRKGDKLSTLNSQASTFPARRPLRAKSGKVVTQLWYARQGIVTPEMEFIAIRENLGKEEFRSKNSQVEISPNDLHHRHSGSEPIENRKSKIGNPVTPEF